MHVYSDASGVRAPVVCVDVDACTGAGVVVWCGTLRCRRRGVVCSVVT